MRMPDSGKRSPAAHTEGLLTAFAATAVDKKARTSRRILHRESGVEQVHPMYL